MEKLALSLGLCPPHIMYPMQFLLLPDPWLPRASENKVQEVAQNLRSVAMETSKPGGAIEERKRTRTTRMEMADEAQFPAL
jgi:hypothetical protein